VHVVITDGGAGNPTITLECELDEDDEVIACAGTAPMPPNTNRSCDNQGHYVWTCSAGKIDFDNDLDQLNTLAQTIGPNGQYPAWPPAGSGLFAGCQSDNDSDGYGAGIRVGIDDCNDNNAAIHPGANDPANDGIDQDCDGNNNG
jgi:hypothetical protein